MHKEPARIKPLFPSKQALITTEDPLNSGMIGMSSLRTDDEVRGSAGIRY